MTATTTTVTEPDVCRFADHSERVLAAVWQVGGLAGRSGTAFYIGDGEWLTAAHVVGDATNAVLYNEFRELPVTVVGVDSARDTALLVDSGADVPSLELSDSLPRPGASAYVVGFPLYDELSASISRGIVSRLEQDQFLGTVVVTDAATNPGNSGGPLVDDCGRVMGLVVRKYVDVTVEGLGYALAAEEMEDRLSQLRRGGGSSSIIIGERTPWWIFFPSVSSPSISGDFTGPLTQTKYPSASVAASDLDGPISSPGASLSVSCDFWLLSWNPEARQPHEDQFSNLVFKRIEVTYWIDSGPGRDTVWTHAEDTSKVMLSGDAAAQLSSDLQDNPQARALTFRASVDGSYMGEATFPLRGYVTQRAELDRHCGR